MQTTPLLDEIEAFMAKTAMSATAFGQAAAKDRNFVHQLRKGRHCFPRKEQEVRDWMDEQRDDHEGEAA